MTFAFSVGQGRTAGGGLGGFPPRLPKTLRAGVCGAQGGVVLSSVIKALHSP